jgi:hypothetical protein
MADSNKLPSGIVDTVINKISDFTKELEILRGQLPTRESLAKDNTKTLDAIGKLVERIDSMLTVIKTVFALAMIVVALSFFGAQIIDYVKTPTSTITIEEIQAANKVSNEELKKEISLDREKDLEEIKQQIINELAQKEEPSVSKKVSK